MKKLFFFLAVTGLLYGGELSDKYNYQDRTKGYNNLNIPDVVKINELSIKKNENLKSIQKVDNKNMRDFSKTIVDKTNTQEFQTQIKDMKEYILNDKQFGYKGQMQEYREAEASKPNQKETLSVNERFYIVVSSSLDKSLIQKYIKQTEPIKNDVEFVLRGTIGGHKKMKPTLDWRNEVLKNGDSYFNRSIKIDPVTVKKYNIKKVPAFLYIEDITDEKSSYDVVYGSVHISLALQELSKINKNSKSLKKLSEKYN